MLQLINAIHAIPPSSARTALMMGSDFSTKNGQKYVLVFSVLWLCRFVHQVFFLSVPMFSCENCVLPGFQTLQVHETSVFTVYSVLCYFPVFLHWYLQFTSVFTSKFTPSLPHGAPLSFFCWYLRCLNCCFALWTSNDFLRLSKKIGVYTFK